MSWHILNNWLLSWQATLATHYNDSDLKVTKDNILEQKGKWTKCVWSRTMTWEMILQMMLLNDCYHQAPGVQDNLQECNIEWRWVRRTGPGGFFCLFSQSQSFFLYESRRLASWRNPSNFSGLGEKKRREAKGGGGSKAGRSFIKSFS